MRTEILLAIAAAVFVLGLGIGWKWRDYQAQGEALVASNAAMDKVKAGLVARDAVSAADAEKSKTLEELLAAIRRNHAQVQIVREKSYATNPVYSSCVLPADGLRLLNERIADHHPAADPGKRESSVR